MSQMSSQNRVVEMESYSINPDSEESQGLDNSRTNDARVTLRIQDNHHGKTLSSSIVNDLQEQTPLSNQSNLSKITVEK